MAKSTNALIRELQSNRRLMGTCPECQEDFRLADFVLFSIDDEPPEAALAAIQAAREQIRERKQELVRWRERMTKRAEKTAEAVNIGKIIEKILPSFSTFSYAPGDCRALFEPIDYLVFSGLTAEARVEALVFIDVKSGNARLKHDQKSIKAAVEAGSVSFANTRA